MRTDVEEATALSHEQNIVDVYTNSWGPSDTGNIVMGPRTLTKLTLEKGISEVRSRSNVEQFCNNKFCRDVMEKGPYLCGPVVTEEMKMTVLLMATCPVYTPLLLELLELIVIIVFLMRDVRGKW